MTFLRTTLAMFLLAATVAPAAALPPRVLTFPPPAVTGWAPEGCRSVPAGDPVLGTRDRWRFLHSDAAASDEVDIALAPYFEADWTAEPQAIFVAVPVFDRDGNLYATPFLPYENVALVSLDPTDGSRRWVIAGTGAPTGAVAPMVLDDPDNPGEDIIYLTLADRAVAVRPDGTVVWDVATGLSLTGVLREDAVTGNSYLPAHDAIVALSGGGKLYALDRATGSQLLDAPFSLPGLTSPAGAGLAIPAEIFDNAEAQIEQFLNFPPGSSFLNFLAAILGNEIEVSNSFAIDAHTGRMWIAATAPDDVDGSTDGVSEFGSIYGIDIVDNMGTLEAVIGCRRDFDGGSASTPSLRSDGTRVYVADNDGRLIALDADCNEIWNFSLASQITGSIAVSSDNNELYASTQSELVQIIDEGAEASLGWVADLEVYLPLAAGRENFNTLLASVAANGIGFMAGIGPPPGALANIGLPIKVGYGVLDRETGSVRYFADGLDESVAELTVGPDGAYYNANSPVRRAFTKALFDADTEPITGGIRKFLPRRRELLVRDALCAAADRAANAEIEAGVCADAAAADEDQLDVLENQADCEFPAAKQARLDALLADLPASLAVRRAGFDAACRLMNPCPATPAAGCRTAGKTALQLQLKDGAVPNADKFKWKWVGNDAVEAAELGAPLQTSDYALCVWDDTDTTAQLIYDIALPASAELWKEKNGKVGYKDAASLERGVKKLSFKAGEAGRASLKVAAGGAQLYRGDFAISPSVVAQLTDLDSGLCWESTFADADVRKRDGTTFKAAKK
jgi:outer membrane protein assembly factor BamB